MRRRDDDNSLLHSIVLAAGMGVLLGVLIHYSGSLISRDGTASMPAGGEKVDEPLQGTTSDVAPGSDCAEVVRTCKVSATFRAIDCNDEMLRRRIKSELSHPLGREECQQTQRDLEAVCGTGCMLDYGSMIVVPGKITYDFTPEEGGQKGCLARGSRPVTIQASCVPSRK